ncbi:MULTISPECIES: exonuclease subunit SbcC [Spirulina sp. CCY15215]|uniref:exonuclease subunit SbcC n=1 Tax=Spirulina sp. CCY15215 TaxID=2767591 RepID=UPI0019521AB9|nr:exonuclease subunit SbcC [Spirulina major]
MIPLQLILKNFLSYREAKLDFQGLHTACICGSNGAGKSSLLEAITWVVWGKSRVGTDDVINAGEKTVRVDFTFIVNQETYRIIRSRQRGRSTDLQFQIQTESGRFRPLTGKGIKPTQEQIIKDIKLDYDTFINSAYLRQGRADEFMLRTASERKKVLADLLKLDRYEELSIQAKDTAKQFKNRTEYLEQSLQPLEQKMARQGEIEQERKAIAVQLEGLQDLQDIDDQKLKTLQLAEHDRDNEEKKLTWQQNQYRNTVGDCDRLLRDREQISLKLTQTESFLQRGEEIQRGYQDLKTWQSEEEKLAGKLKDYQSTKETKRQLEAELIQKSNEIELKIQQVQTQLDNITQQEQENQTILATSEEVDRGLEKLQSYRQRVQDLEQLKLQVTPLLQQRNELQIEIERVQAKLNAKLEQLRLSQQELADRIARIPQRRLEYLEIEEKIVECENKKNYQKRVQDKGQEQKIIQERLQESKLSYKEQIEKLQQKLALLQIPDAACPLCDRPLDEHYRDRVISKTQSEQEKNQQQILIIGEQMATCEVELNGLREEYAQLNRQISAYGDLQNKKGQLEAELETGDEDYDRLQEIAGEIEEKEESLKMGNYALDLHAELQNLDQEIAELDYNEETLALARGEADRLRHWEIKQAKIKDVKRKQKELDRQKPELLARRDRLQESRDRLRQDSDIQEQIQQIEVKLTTIGYDGDRHETARQTLQKLKAQKWDIQHYELQQAEEQLPQLQSNLQEIQTRLKIREGDRDKIKIDLDELVAKMQQIPDYRNEIKECDRIIQQRRQQLDELLAKQGKLEQQLTQLQETKVESEKTKVQLKEVGRQYRVYHELSKAFSKNGIQALMIENILPQLEAQTNQILARLTGNQLHVQFVTQKAKKSASSRQKTNNTIDTLEIVIADARGTRAYETYSGGEAFRINFAIRLALAKILAQRSGASLQLLIIDEGFGTQDAEGCDRLIAAINAIASDFSCILTVTHMNRFKEAFEHRIEISKTSTGSQINLLS